MDPLEANMKSELMREVFFSFSHKVFLLSLRLTSRLFVCYVVVGVLNLIVIWILRFQFADCVKAQSVWVCYVICKVNFFFSLGRPPGGRSGEDGHQTERLWK